MLRTLIITFTVAILIIAPLMIIVWSRNEVITTGYEISKLLKERERLLDENIRLKRRIEELTAPSRLYSIAVNRGFHRAGSSEVLIIPIGEEGEK